jgi:hypothetical protein
MLFSFSATHNDCDQMIRYHMDSNQKHVYPVYGESVSFDG